MIWNIIGERCGQPCNVIKNNETFIADVVRIDCDVADVINQNKENFYEEYSYLKPDCEKNGWEKACDGLKSIGDWCKEHWKVVVTVVLVVAAVVLICTGVGGPFGAIILGAAQGLITGAAAGGLIGGLSSLAEGGSFLKGFEEGAFAGALTGALFGGIGGAGEALGALGKLGTSCDALGRLTTVAKVSGALSVGMGLFDTLSLGLELFAPGNVFTAFNKKLHSSTLYNAFQFSVSALAVFSLGGIKGFLKKTPHPTCFAAGTMILTVSGVVAIENIRAGDKVIATNAETFEKTEKTVLETYIRKTNTFVHLVSNGEEVVDNQETVYNFQVEEFHTYHVGYSGILVHNAECGSNTGNKLQEIFDVVDDYNLSDDIFNNHILDRHGPNSVCGNKSRFNLDFDIKNGIDSTLRGDNFVVGPNTAGREGYIFERTFTNPIGISNKGKPVYTLKVVVDEIGKVITAFPKK